MNKKINLAIFASYNGTNINPIYKAMQNNQLNISIKLLITNNSNSNALKIVQNLNINSYIVNDKTSSNTEKDIFNLLKKYNCKYIVLSGYMKKLSLNIVNNFTIINTHPSLLPLYGGVGMYGRCVHEAVIKNNEKSSGVTVHYVNEHYDDGKIILQETLILNDEETVESLQKRIKKLEQRTIIKALQICLK
jgi:phosphoribosylglycinamide formyltransferase-1